MNNIPKEKSNILSRNKNMYMSVWYKSLIVFLVITLVSCGVSSLFLEFDFDVLLVSFITSAVCVFVAYITKKKYK